MKKITFLLLSLLLFIATVATSVSAVPPPAIITTDNFIGSIPIVVANGSPIIVTSGDTEGLTNIYIDTNDNGIIDSGETPIDFNEPQYIFSSEPDVKNSVTNNGTYNTTTGFNLSQAYIYIGTVHRSTSYDYVSSPKVTMESGNVFTIMLGYNFQDNFTGTAEININGGTISKIRDFDITDPYTDMDNSLIINISNDAKVGEITTGSWGNSPKIKNFTINLKDNSEVNTISIKENRFVDATINIQGAPKATIDLRNFTGNKVNVVGPLTSDAQDIILTNPPSTDYGTVLVTASDPSFLKLSIFKLAGQNLLIDGDKIKIDVEETPSAPSEPSTPSEPTPAPSPNPQTHSNESILALTSLMILSGVVLVSTKAKKRK